MSTIHAGAPLDEAVQASELLIAERFIVDWLAELLALPPPPPLLPPLPALPPPPVLLQLGWPNLGLTSGLLPAAAAVLSPRLVLVGENCARIAATCAA
ncbi:MAG: hypothetical protein AB1568_03660 [Thermodesulfobacteriota bacterium]